MYRDTAAKRHSATYLGPLSIRVWALSAAHQGGTASGRTREASSQQISQILRDLLCHAKEFGLFEESYIRADGIVFVS